MADEFQSSVEQVVQYVNSNRLQEAESLCRSLLSAHPANVDVLRMLGAILVKVGQEDEAEAVRAQFIEHASADELLREADALRLRGEKETAETLCDVVLIRDPENIGPLRVFAMIATDDERFIVAEGFLKRIVKLAPESVRPLCDLGQFLSDRGRFHEAIVQLQKAVELQPDSADAQVLLGNMFGIVGRNDDALKAYDRCLQQRPNDPAALIGRGHMLRIAGRQDDALASYRLCTRFASDIGPASWYMASLHGYIASDDEVAAMRSHLESNDLVPESAVALNFALARACEHREKFDVAWSYYSAGNAGKRALVSYDPVKTELDQRRIRKTFSADLLSSNLGKRTSRSSDKTPIFIVGMPRSGSTLIEQILANHSNVEGTGELPYIPMMAAGLDAEHSDSLHYSEVVESIRVEELTKLGASYLQSASTHCENSAAFFTDKTPGNFSHLGFIQMILPHARIIDARRSPMATCVANYRQLFAQGKNQSYDLTELGEYYLQYIDTMTHWEEVLPGKVLRVQYEDVVADLESQVRRMLEFCDLSFETSCVDFHKSGRPVNTASSEQVRKPIYDSALEFWRNYDPHLDELREVLKPDL